jgi:hypothetical protein
MKCLVYCIGSLTVSIHEYYVMIDQMRNLVLRDSLVFIIQEINKVKNFLFREYIIYVKIVMTTYRAVYYEHALY